MEYWGKKILVVLIIAIFAIATFITDPADARPRRKIKFDKGIEVKGKIIRPEMSLILQRSKINYDALKLNESFLERIVRSVKQKPF